MSVVDHLGSLKAKHAELEAAIADETRRPHPDTAQISDLKKQKLRIKEEIEGMGRH